MLFAAKPDVIYQPLNEGAVLFSTVDEVYFGLNEVAARIWEALPATTTWEELYAAIQAHYPTADAETIRADVRRLVDDLLDQRLLLPPHTP